MSSNVGSNKYQDMVYDFLCARARARARACVCVSALFSNVLLMTIIQPEGSGRDSWVGIATRYGLDDPGIESQYGGRDLPPPSRPALRPTQHPRKWVPGLFPRCRAAGAWGWPSSTAEFKERVYLYPSPLWAFMACYRVKFTNTFTCTRRYCGFNLAKKVLIS